MKKTLKLFWGGWIGWLKVVKISLKKIPPKLKNLKIFEEEEKNQEFKVREGDSALKMFARQFTIDGKPGYDPRTFFEAIRDLVLEILRKNKNTKLKLILNCKMQRTDLKIGETDEVDAEFHSEIETNLEGKDENELFDKMIARIDENIANLQRRGSNWQFVSINRLEIRLGDWKPLGGSSFIPLPKKIRNKGAVINMKNDDDQCFKWSVTRAMNPVEKNSERITKELKDQSVRLHWSGLLFPVDLKLIRVFEKFNPEISVNVFGFTKNVYPLRISETKRRLNVNLLLISAGEKQHYCLIKSLNRLLSSQVSGHKESKSFCLNCLNHFPNEKKLKIHKEYCLNNEAIKIEMPEKGSFISFIHHNDP